MTLLGIVFFFVLSMQRGWIGPSLRVSLGAIASALVFGAGVWLRRRHGDVYSAYAAIGAGIAGAYATLLAAAALYELVPGPVALVLAALVAAVGTATALAWGSETVAALGLVGAILVPVAVLGHEDISVIGTAFAALVLAGTIVVALRREWWWLLGAAVAASAPQAVALMLDADGRHGSALAVAIAFWLLYATAGVAGQRGRELAAAPSSLLVFSGAFAGASCQLLYDGRAAGTATLVAALAYAVLAVAGFAAQRDVWALAAAIALAVGAVAAAQLLDGNVLAVAWAAEAAVLAWLARRVREIKLQLASLVWLGLAIAHAIGVDAPPHDLLETNAHPAQGVAAVLAAALAAAVVALHARAWERTGPEGGILRPLSRLLEDLRRSQDGLRLDAWLAGGALALYATSLGVLGLAVRIGDDVGRSFGWGHVAVVGLWGVLGLAAVAFGRRAVGVALGAAGVALAVADAHELLTPQRSWALLVAAAAALAIGYVASDGRIDLTVLGTATSTPLALYGLVGIVDILDGDAFGFAVLGIAAVHAGLAAVAALRRRRDLGTLHWATALALAAPASLLVLQGTWIVLAWAATAVGLVLLARRTGESRLELASLAYVALALAWTIGMAARPDLLFLVHAHPGLGAPAALLVAAAAAAWAWNARRAELWWTSATLVVYAASLALLELFQHVGGATPELAYQRGHTAVSTLWGLIGLALLYTGLRRGTRSLQLGGFALFGVSLTKLFLYDLAFLSSVARSFSFLAVGGVLLAAGFFYQRLAVDSRA